MSFHSRAFRLVRLIDSNVRVPRSESNKRRLLYEMRLYNDRFLCAKKFLIKKKKRSFEPIALAALKKKKNARTSLSAFHSADPRADIASEAESIDPPIGLYVIG